MATLMTQVAQATGANFTVLVISSEPLGTQAEELAGAPQFALDVATPANKRSAVGYLPSHHACGHTLQGSS